MVNHKFTYDELLIRLENQTNLLADLCSQFDNGKYEYVDIIATKINTIINFNERKESLIPNMNRQTTMKFCSSSKVLDTYENVLMYRALVSSTYLNGEVQYIPKLNNGKRHLTWRNYKTWSSAPVLLMNIGPRQDTFDGLIYVHKINNETQKVLTRKDIIMFYRNQYDGAHSDPNVKKLFHDIAAGISSVEHLDHPDARYVPGEKYKAGKPIKYLFEMAVRQIAHELIVSIKNEFGFFVKYKPDYRCYSQKRPKDLTDILVTCVKEHENGQKEVKIDHI